MNSTFAHPKQQASTLNSPQANPQPSATALPPAKTPSLAVHIWVLSLSVAVAFGITLLAHLWLNQIEVPIEWQAILVGPYSLLIIGLCLWQAVRQPQRRFRLMLAVLGFSIGAVGGIYLVHAFPINAFVALSASLFVLLLTSIGALFAALRS